MKIEREKLRLWLAVAAVMTPASIAIAQDSFISGATIFTHTNDVSVMPPTTYTITKSSVITPPPTPSANYQYNHTFPPSASTSFTTAMASAYEITSESELALDVASGSSISQTNAGAYGGASQLNIQINYQWALGSSGFPQTQGAPGITYSFPIAGTIAPGGEVNLIISMDFYDSTAPTTTIGSINVNDSHTNSFSSPLSFTDTVQGTTFLTPGSGTGVGTSLTMVGDVEFQSYSTGAATNIALSQDGQLGFGQPATLTWDNAGGSGDGRTWDIETNQNWNNGLGQAVFDQSDSVTFNDNNNGNYNITLSSTVSPSTLIFATTQTYQVTGVGGITGVTGLTKMGIGTLFISTNNTYLGTTAVQQGLLQLGSNAALPIGTTVTLGDSNNDNGTLDLDGSNATVGELAVIGSGTSNAITNSSPTASTLTFASGLSTYPATISGKMTLAIASGTLTLSGTNTYTGGTQINGGTLLIAAASALPNSGTVTVANVLTPSTPAILQLGAGSGTSTLSALVVNSGGTVDITNNTLVIPFTSSDPAATIRSLLISGYNASGAHWAGTGITSSQAAADPTQFAVGYADGGNTIDRANAKVPSGIVEIEYTVAGDVNLSGTVDLSDLVIIASDFGMSGADWAEGDVNYDGNVDLSDLVIVASNFGASVGSVSGADFSSSFAAEWQLALAEAHGVDVSVPEPCSLLGLAACALLKRRRQR